MALSYWPRSSGSFPGLRRDATALSGTLVSIGSTASTGSLSHRCARRSSCRLSSSIGAGCRLPPVTGAGTTTSRACMTLHCAAPQACRFKPIYHLLVTLYFFRHVSIDRDFVADFAHPIDGTLAAFLQARRNQLACPKPLSQPSPKPQHQPKPKPSPARLLRALSGSPSTRRSPEAPSRAWWPVARSLAPRRRSSRPPRRAGQSRPPARLVHRSSRLVHRSSRLLAPLLARRRAVARRLRPPD